MIAVRGLVLEGVEGVEAVVLVVAALLVAVADGVGGASVSVPGTGMAAGGVPCTEGAGAAAVGRAVAGDEAGAGRSGSVDKTGGRSPRIGSDGGTGARRLFGVRRSPTALITGSTTTSAPVKPAANQSLAVLFFGR